MNGYSQLRPYSAAGSTGNTGNVSEIPLNKIRNNHEELNPKRLERPLTGDSSRISTNQPNNNTNNSSNNNNNSNSNSNNKAHQNNGRRSAGSSNGAINGHPGSSRGGKSVSRGTGSGMEPYFVVAFVQNRANEVGLAAIDVNHSPELLLSQYSDNPTFGTSLSMMYLYNPQDLIVPNDTNGTERISPILASYLSQQTVVQGFHRKNFSDIQGKEIIKRLSNERSSTFDTENYKYYLAMSAACALIKYLEVIKNRAYAAGSLKVILNSPEGRMMIDGSTINHLELLRNLRTGDQKNSLYGFMNHTKTQGGARLLKGNIIQPLSDTVTIKTRLDAVEDILSNESAFFAIQTLLPRFKDIDKILNCLVQISNVPNNFSQIAESRLNNMLALKTALVQIPLLANEMTSLSSILMLAILQNIQTEKINEILNKITRVIEEDATFSTTAINLRTQQCIAVRHGISGLLDVARVTYGESLEEIHKCVADYREEHHINDIKIVYSKLHGYSLSMPTQAMSNFESRNTGNLSSLFINQLIKGKTVTCSTEQVVGLNERNKSALSDIIRLSARVIEECAHDIRQDIDILYKIAESIAMTDMLMTFATIVTLGVSMYSKPEFTDTGGPMAIRQGRHPIMERTFSAMYHPNDTFMTEASNFQLVTGPNMSGKTTYMKQVALITIMAHMGCYVSSEFASFPPIDHIFSRLNTGDHLESNTGTFMLEMKDMALIIEGATNRSLVIIDELGRGTSTKEGTGIAWAVSEYLAAIHCFTIFSTHYYKLNELQSFYPNIRNFNLMVNITSSNNNNNNNNNNNSNNNNSNHNNSNNISAAEPVTTTNMIDISYLYTLSEGAITQTSYGLLVAEKGGLPPSILTLATALRDKLSSPHHPPTLRGPELQRHQRYALAERLLSLKNSTLSQSALRSYLKDIKINFTVEDEINP